MKILLVDNYDSFTYNLVHLVEEILQHKITVIKNDELNLSHVNTFDKIILSPGPGVPSQAGLLLPLIKQFTPIKPILGVCLGHQAIAESFGGTLINLEKIYHGVSENLHIIKEHYLFKNLPKKIVVGRYHSWLVNTHNLPKELTVIAIDDENQIMAMSHKIYNVVSVQFHPESILTPFGKTMMKNWIYYKHI